MPFKILGIRADNRVGDESDFAEFRISEVKYIKVYRPKNKSHHIPIYYTSHGSYAPLLTLRDLTDALNPRGFQQLDSSTLVNKSRVVSMTDTDRGLCVVFDDNTCVNVAKKSRKR